MKYLLYCILRTREIRDPGCPPGVDGQPVSLVKEGGLSAVTSRIADERLAPDLLRILAYEKVVEAFHRAQTVIPMRYGCLVKEKFAIAQLLEERRQPYERLLEELAGGEEMGIRIIAAGTDPDPAPAVHSSSSRNDSARGISWKGDPTFPPQGGQAYLAAQKMRYAAKDRLTHEEERIAGRVCARLAGLYIRSKIENPAPVGNRLISLYFLTPRGSVPAFRMAFRQMGSWGESKLLLSGPWPPYNFAQTDRSKPQGSLLLGV